RLLADLPLGEIRDDDLAIVHRVRQVELRSDLAQYEPDIRRRRELSRLIKNRRDGLAPEALVVAGKLLRPEAPRYRISNPADDAGSEGVVGVDPWQIDQGRPAGLDERGDAVIEQVLGSRPPRLAPPR